MVHTETVADRFFLCHQNLKIRFVAFRSITTHYTLSMVARIPNHHPTLPSWEGSNTRLVTHISIKRYTVSTRKQDVAPFAKSDETRGTWDGGRKGSAAEWNFSTIKGCQVTELKSALFAYFLHFLRANFTYIWFSNGTCNELPLLHWWKRTVLLYSGAISLRSVTTTDYSAILEENDCSRDVVACRGNWMGTDARWRETSG